MNWIAGWPPKYKNDEGGKERQPEARRADRQHEDRRQQRACMRQHVEAVKRQVEHLQCRRVRARHMSAGNVTRMCRRYSQLATSYSCEQYSM